MTPTIFKHSRNEKKKTNFKLNFTPTSAIFLFMKILYVNLVIKIIGWDLELSQWRKLRRLGAKNLHSLSPRANYTDRATAACRRS
jgi:hypothetical protein